MVTFNKKICIPKSVFSERHSNMIINPEGNVLVFLVRLPLRTNVQIFLYKANDFTSKCNRAKKEKKDVNVILELRIKYSFLKHNKFKFPQMSRNNV